MSSDLERRAEDIFEASLKLPMADRPAAIEAACGENRQLIDRVQSTVVSMRQAEGFMSDATMDAESATPEAAAAALIGEKPGDRIGRYKLLQQIGEGGFGVVFLAEQERPVRRQVALKVIKLGMDTSEVVARFEAERQALALMDHPNIAKVLDAGSTETGRPYFVMELVRGSPITDYCDKHKLNTKIRVALMVQVCRAVQHAHAKGVIHRDLKPTNVLVTTADDKPIPKVIDFGIAKATQSKLTDRTLFTQFRQLIGTPQYMSPEQADSDGTDVDTRTDVYSLGVMLYELLVGTTPFDAKQLRSAAFEAMRKMIREQEPPKPSTRLSGLGDTLATVAGNRGTDARRLGEAVKGELDWIVMRAIEKDRSRRYDTAAAMADDMNRFLAGDAVLASPVSGAYRLTKTLKRYKTAVAIGLAIVMCLLLGAAGTTWGWLRSERLRHAAEQARAEADHQRMLAEMGTYDARATLLVSKQKYAEALPLWQKLVQTRRQTLGPYDPQTLLAVRDEVATLQYVESQAKAFERVRKVVETARKDGHGNMPELADLYLAAMTGGVNIADPAGQRLVREVASVFAQVRPPTDLYRKSLTHTVADIELNAGRFDVAKKEYADMVATGHDYHDQFEYARLCAFLGDTVEYGRTVAEMRRRYSRSDDAEEREGTVRMALALPPVAPADADEFSAMLDYAAAHENAAWPALTRALLDYRCGRFDLARSECEQVYPLLLAWAKPQAQIIAAMSMYRLGRKVEARQRWIDSETGTPPLKPNAAYYGEIKEEGYLDREMLRREAIHMLGVADSTSRPVAATLPAN